MNGSISAVCNVFKVITVIWETSQGVNGKLFSDIDSISIFMDKVHKHKILKRI